MITRDIYILGWKIHWCFFTSDRNKEEVIDLLEGLNAENILLSRIYDNKYLDGYDYGFTYSNMSKHESVVVIGQTTSGHEFLNTFIHELHHLTIHIAETLNIELGAEETAYLAGDIAMEVADIVCKYSCNSCRNKF